MIRIVNSILLVILISCGGGSGSSPLSPTTSTPEITGCNGKAYCILYVTADNTVGGNLDSTGNNNLNGIEEADDLCNSDSAKPNNSTYKAVLSDGTNRIACTSTNCTGGLLEHVDWPLARNTEYRREDEVTVIFKTGSNGIRIDDFPNTINSVATSIYTGLNVDWRSSPNNCNSWSVSTGVGSGGDTSRANTNSIGSSSTSCSWAVAQLLCAEQ